MKEAANQVNKGLPQGLVLGRLLFNFTYLIFQMIEKILLCEWYSWPPNTNLSLAQKKFSIRILSYYILNLIRGDNNKMANSQISEQLRNSTLNHNKHSKYLGVALDRTLSYRKHLENSATKIRIRNNIIQNLYVHTGSVAVIPYLSTDN